MKNKPTKCLNVVFCTLALIVGVTEVAAGENRVSGSETVEIEMREWTLLLSREKLRSGKINFTVYNRGKETHELVVAKLNDGKMNSGQLPVNKHGSIDEDNITFGKIIGEIEDIKAGKKASKVFSLKPGRYAVICNILEKESDGRMESHYSQGMHALLEVE